MAKPQKTQEMQEVEHAYANLEHQEWAEDMRQWKGDFERMSEMLTRAQKWFANYGAELKGHEEALKRHESAV